MKHKRVMLSLTEEQLQRAKWLAEEKGIKTVGKQKTPIHNLVEEMLEPWAGAFFSSPSLCAEPRSYLFSFLLQKTIQKGQVKVPFKRVCLGKAVIHTKDLTHLIQMRLNQALEELARNHFSPQKIELETLSRAAAQQLFEKHRGLLSFERRGNILENLDFFARTSTWDIFFLEPGYSTPFGEIQYLDDQLGLVRLTSEIASSNNIAYFTPPQANLPLPVEELVNFPSDLGPSNGDLFLVSQELTKSWLEKNDFKNMHWAALVSSGREPSFQRGNCIRVREEHKGSYQVVVSSLCRAENVESLDETLFVDFGLEKVN